LGGSVAAGAYSSETSKTYFEKLVSYLNEKRIKAKTIIYAAGAWVSRQEIIALLYKGLNLKPHIIVFLDGLNDLTNIQDKTYEEKVSDYINNMRVAMEICMINNIKLTYALQPFLPYKKIKSFLEKRILQLSIQDENQLKKYYGTIREGLSGLVQTNIYFIDTSDVLSEEKETTFADIWHFSDHGHDLLGKFLSEQLSEKVLSHP
jgi:hypothetical protein